MTSKELELCKNEIKIPCEENKCLDKAIVHLENSIYGLQKANLRMMFKLLFDSSPMISKRIDIYNLLCVVLIKVKDRSLL